MIATARTWSRQSDWSVYACHEKVLSRSTSYYVADLER